MGLQKYHSKRNFKKTTEPKGELASKKDHLQFVVQEHHASTLHYDFRLEMEGVLRSWAIPKGPSNDPSVKRLAVEVEDHPVEYGKFQGVIPKGEYGAGRVVRWDRGTWKSVGNDPVAAYKKGRIDFELHGDKLKGRWLLVRTRRGSGSHKQWLLIKRHDTADRAHAPQVKTLDARVKLPKKIGPHLAVLVKDAPVGDEWIHEIKFDGYRLICRIEGGKIQLLTRQGLDWTHKFKALADEIENIGLKNTILDGEVVCLNDDGVSDFSCLQNTLSKSSTGKKKALIYYVFDLLFLNGNDLRERTLLERKELLETMLREHPSKKTVRYSEHVTGQGPKFFDQCCKSGLEGMISKRAASIYVSERNEDWLKVKCENRQEFVIGGYTDPQGSRQDFGALLLGLNDKKGLKYVGKTGTGFDEATLRALKAKFKKLETDESPFYNHESAKGTHWLEPKLVAEIRFAGFTDSGSVRQGAFLGLREDKPAAKVGVEKAKKAAPAKAVRAKDVRPKLTHPDKVLFRDTGYTKQDVADYYEAISDKILPFLKDRPLTLLRCPAGGDKHCFFQRHGDLGNSPFLHEIEIKEAEEKDQREPYLYIDSLEGILQLVQMGSLEFHVWNSTIAHVTKPDTIVFDLDPDKKFPWSTVVEASHEIRETLEDLGLKSFAKLSGGKGVHIQLPIEPDLDWETVKNFSHSFVKILVEKNPKLYTDNIRKEARKGKIFVDYLRNGFASTAVVAYGLRNRPGTPVAMPIAWKELTPKIKPDEFSLDDALKRLKRQKRDPWSDYWKTKQSLEILKSKK